MKRLRSIEISAWVLGATLIAVWTGFWLHSRLSQRSDLTRFEEAKAVLAAQQPAHSEATAGPSSVALNTSVSNESAVARSLSTHQEVDVSLWAEGRIEKYRESLHEVIDAPQAILRIPDLELEVAVHEGTSELVLNRGVGWIEGTAGVEQAGNIGLAGHRDGFFRGLKNLDKGDLLELETLTRTRRFEIDRISIVQPEEVWVLEPDSVNRLTLVTCYPFYFVGKAPLRYIVHSREVTTGVGPPSGSQRATP